MPSSTYITYEKAVEEIKAIANLANLTGFFSASKHNEQKGMSYMFGESFEVHGQEQAEAALIDTSYHVVSALGAAIQYLAIIDLLCNNDKDNTQVAYEAMKETITKKMDKIVAGMEMQGHPLPTATKQRMRDLINVLNPNT